MHISDTKLKITAYLATSLPRSDYQNSEENRWHHRQGVVYHVPFHLVTTLLHADSRRAVSVVVSCTHRLASWQLPSPASFQRQRSSKLCSAPASSTLRKKLRGRTAPKQPNNGCSRAWRRGAVSSKFIPTWIDLYANDDANCPSDHGRKKLIHKKLVYFIAWL